MMRHVLFVHRFTVGVSDMMLPTLPFWWVIVLDVNAVNSSSLPSKVSFSDYSLYIIHGVRFIFVTHDSSLRLDYLHSLGTIVWTPETGLKLFKYIFDFSTLKSHLVFLFS